MRLLKIFRRELWLRRIPHGAISPAFIWARDARVEAHRAMFWDAKPNLPKPVYLTVQLILWIKWMALFGWLALFRSLRYFGAVTRDQCGISQTRQFLRLLRTTFWACMPPSDAYRFGVIAHPERLWNYVSDQHIAAYHSYRNRLNNVTPETIANLGDKLETSRALEAYLMPIAPTIESVSKGDEFNFLATLKTHGHLFCKEREGRGGMGAFECWVRDGEIGGRLFEKHALPDQAAVIAAWNALLRRGEALVQPALPNHPLLIPLAPDGRTITVRCITERGKGTSSILCTSIEIPLKRRAGDNRSAYVILPIDHDSGEITAMPDGSPQHPETGKANTNLMKRWDAGRALPNWDELITQSKAAHDQFPDIWAIAWDWVLTPQGPVLLEGNNGFSGTMPQMLTNGFMRRENLC